jgi:hypothetical protein
MPTTRSQVRKGEQSTDDQEGKKSKPEKNFLKIPAKTDLTLFRRSGGCIDSVPSAIFTIIQCFLSEREYRELMNTSLVLFQDIKFHTVKYNFRGPENWKKMEGFLNKKSQKDFFLNLMNSNVSSKSQQVDVLAFEPSQRNLTENADIFQGIHKLRLICHWRTDLSNFPLSFAFSNICHLVLINVELSDTFPAGLVNVSVLELQTVWSLRDINELRHVITLKKLVIENCHDLEEMSELTNIPTMIVTGTAVQDFTFLGRSKMSYLRIFIHDRERQLLTKFSNLQALSLNCAFPYENSEFFLLPLQNIPLIRLVNRNWNSDMIRTPVLYGKQVKLQNFDLSLWQGAELLHLEVLELISCKISVFPVVSNLHSLKLSDCIGLVIVPFLPKLKKCYICGETSTIADVSMLSHVHYLQLRGLPLITDVSRLGKIPHLVFGNLCALQSLEGLGGSRGNSEIIISYCQKVTDFSPLKDMFRLYLERMAHFSNAEQVAGVSHLTISSCSSLKDTRPLGHVKSLHLIDCHGIEALDGLKNVPRLFVEQCSNLKDFSGIGNNEFVGFLNYTCSKLKQMRKDFEKNGTNAEIFAGIKEIQFDRRWNDYLQRVLSRDLSFITFVKDHFEN